MALRQQRDVGWQLRYVGLALTGFVFLVAGASLAGRVFEIQRLDGTEPILPALNPLTAACLAILGTALACASPLGAAPVARRFALALALIATSIAFAHSIDTATLGLFRIDEWLFRSALERDGRLIVWHIRLAGAVAIALSGIAIALLPRPSRRAAAIGSCAALGVVAIALLNLSGHAFGAQRSADASFFVPMIPSEAVAFLALGAAILLARPDRPLLAVALDPGPAGVAFRRWLPASILVPFLLGWLRLSGQRHGWFDTEHGVAISVVFTIVLLTAALWWGTHALQRSEATRLPAEGALQMAESLRDLAVEAGRIGCWEWDLLSGRVACNRTLHELWGTAEHPEHVEKYFERIHPEDRERVNADIAAAAQPGQEYRTTFRVMLPDGSIRVLGGRGRTVLDHAGRPVSMYGINWDATAEYEAARSRELERERELEMRDRFMSHVSHELRSPLTAIVEFVGRLRDGLAGPMSGEQNERLEIARRNASTLQDMIDALIETTRAQTGKLALAPRRMALGPLLNETITSMRVRATRQRVALELEAQDELSDAYADPHRVRQIVVNLIDNALKFTPSGGAIRVALRSHDADAALEVSVADDGRGISAEDRGRIFDHMYKAERNDQARGGLGLGLSICRQLVQAMGGRIGVESEPGHGSRFYFTLPTWSLRDALAPAAERSSASAEFALVTIVLTPLEARPWSVQDERAVAAAFHLAGACTLPDKDVLLPREGGDGRREVFHVLAQADPRGLEVLRSRLDAQLTKCRPLQDTRIEHEVRIAPLLPPVGPEALRTLETRVLEAIRSEETERRNAA